MIAFGSVRWTFMTRTALELLSACLRLEVEGLIGRAISATREANGGARHMGTAMALGHAAGAAAAVSIRSANSTFGVPARLVQESLLQQGACLDVDECVRQTKRMDQHLRALVG